VARIPFVKCTDVVGYTTSDGGVLCVPCHDKTLVETDDLFIHPIFVSSEWDYEVVCDVCLEPIEHITILGQE
jgi:hypothetical protein